jgi:transposase InsO family protein
MGLVGGGRRAVGSVHRMTHRRGWPTCRRRACWAAREQGRTVRCRALELLDRQPRWPTRKALASAIFEWIECFYNPTRRHSYCGMLSPIDYETTTAA